MRKRIQSVLLAIVLTLTLIPFASPPAGAEDPFTFSGKGFGHGVGMGQYGAKSYANLGWGYDAILKHYYTGVSVGAAAVANDSLDVLLAGGQSTVSVTGGNAYAVVDEGNNQAVIAQANANDTFAVSLAADGRYTLVRNGSAVAGSFNGPIRFDPPSIAYDGVYRQSLFSYSGKRYHGSIRVKAAGTALQAINVIYMESYLLGIGEMPSSWPSEALKAQAVASRTFATWRKSSTTGDYDITTGDQAYVGYDKEAEATYGRYWVAAVSATTDAIATHGGSPIQAYFHSSTGGKSENNENVWAGSALPYLRGVDDPNTDSPNDTTGWAYSVPRATLESALGITGVKRISVADATGFSPRAKTMLVEKNDGTSVTMAGKDFRAKLGTMNIKSTWFTAISCPGSLSTQPYGSFLVNAREGDIDGNGRSDIMSFYNYGEATTISWVFNSAASFAPFRAWLSGPGNFEISRTKSVSGDFDGDGKEDALVFYDYGRALTGAWFFKSTGSSFSVSPRWWSGVGGFDLSKAMLVSGDFNGDARDEVLAFYNYGGTTTGAFLFTYDGSTFVPSKIWVSTVWDASRMTPIAADVDGSGKDRVVAFYNYGGAISAAWLFSISPGLTLDRVWSGPGWDQPRTKPVAADTNGDNKDEIISFYDYGKASFEAWSFSWNGTQLNPPISVMTSSSFDISRSHFIPGDYDADGSDEIAASYNYGGATTGIFMFEQGAAGLYAYPAWYSVRGTWDETKMTLIKDSPEPNFVPSTGNGQPAYPAFYRNYKLVALDAGHGGTDPGAIGNGLVEKSVNLDVMLRVRDLLSAQGYQVVTTRTTDTDVNPTFADIDGDGRYTDYDELQARVNVANNAHADIYLSVHHNASIYWSAEGVSVLYGPQSAEGQLLAARISAGISGTTGFYNLGAVARGDLFQTTHTLMPGVISEGGFLTNSTDAVLLMTASGRQAEAQGIVNGINSYYASR